MHGVWVCAAALGLTAGPAPVLAQTAATTVQQDFEAATKLDDAGNNAAALSAWDALERRVSGNKRSLALVRVRKSQSLLALDRQDEAVAAARAGLADLPETDASLAADRYDAYLTLGQIAEAGLDYASAADAYHRAEPLAPTPETRFAAFRGLLATGTFVDLAGAMDTVARADAFIAAAPLEPKSKAIIKGLESHVLLNRGDFRGARADAGEAVKLLGGLTDKTDLYDVGARSDYAIAALLAGDADDARRYMAMTGAGRLPKGNFDPGVQMKAPPCGGDAGLKPADTAVIEFSVNDDGAIIESEPVYAAGGGAAALAFARAVQDWSWSPEQVKALPPFFRYRARVEMRCSTTLEQPSIGDYLDGAFGAWLGKKGVALPPVVTGSDAAALPRLRAQLAAAEAANGVESLAILPVLHALIVNRVLPREEKNALAVRALAILDANHASAPARLDADRIVWMTRSADDWRNAAYRKSAAASLADPHYTGDPEAMAAIRLTLADATRQSDAARSKALLEAVADDPALPANQPLRVAALVRIASIDVGKGDLADARAAFEKSGLSAQQCAILDSPPVLTNTHVGFYDFPREAMAWGFEGWAQMQYDIGADGRVLNPRAIISYPPFVFTKAASDVTSQFSYAKSYRPDGGLGCGGNTQRVKFTLPNR